jgi:hypothetical protein
VATLSNAGGTRDVTAGAMCAVFEILLLLEAIFCSWLLDLFDAVAQEPAKIPCSTLEILLWNGLGNSKPISSHLLQTRSEINPRSGSVHKHVHRQERFSSIVTLVFATLEFAFSLLQR